MIDIFVEASKLNLSSEDTNLIELALSTIFGCDRLLLKLRVRRNELSLLTCRLL